MDQLSGAEAETHSRAIFGAMIAAAKADGHLDPRQCSLQDAELTRLEADHALRQWVQAELDELARQLSLAPDLKTRLESQAAEA